MYELQELLRQVKELHLKAMLACDTANAVEPLGKNACYCEGKVLAYGDVIELIEDALDCYTDEDEDVDDDIDYDPADFEDYEADGDEADEIGYDVYAGCIVFDY